MELGSSPSGATRRSEVDIWLSQPIDSTPTSLLPFGIGVKAAREVLVLVVGVRIPRPELLPGSTMAVQRPVKAMVEGSSPSLAALVEVIK